jgi:diguanylate cyclase (GGDEF)-like protein/PAS domain S-box-containing protein
MMNDIGVEGAPLSTWMLEAEQFRCVVANIPGIVYRSECREPWRMLFISDYVETLLGYGPGDLLGDPKVTFGDLLHPDDRDRINELLEDVLEQQSSYSIEYTLIHAEGSVVWVEEHGRVIREDDGSPLWLDGVIFDVSRRKAAEDARDRAEAELRHQALHDPLTGLPNRALVFDRTKELITSGDRQRSEVALLFIDLDQFKQVNDEFGHQAGDELLRQVAGRLFAAVRSTDIIGRVGGDEFIVILEGPALGKRAVDIAERVNTVLGKPFKLDDFPDVSLSVSASIGVAVGGASAEEILHHADIALYQAKATAKGSHVVFTSRMKDLRPRRSP